MNLWSRIKNVFNNELVSPLDSPEEWVIDALGGQKSSSGIRVNENTAVKVVAVFACIRLISEQLACLPINVYKYANTGKEKDRTHHVDYLISECPNEYMTAFEFWQMMIVNLLLCGDCYAEIVRKNGRPIELWPIPANRVVKDTKNYKEPVYFVQMDDEYRTLYSEDILHIPGMGQEYLKSYNPVVIARDCLGLSLAAERFASDYFANGAHPSGVVETDNALSEPAFERLKQSINEKYVGLGKTNRVMLLEEGMKYKTMAGAPKESQMLETRQHQVVEVARLFNVPPHKIMDMTRATFSNIEELNISFAQDTLVPYCVRIQQAVKQKLFLSHEKKDYFVEYNLGALLRGKLKDRYEAYAMGRNWGWLSVNDIRSKESESTIENGDIYLTPLNMFESGAPLKGGEENG